MRTFAEGPTESIRAWEEKGFLQLFSYVLEV
jgi:hypothetical protein